MAIEVSSTDWTGDAENNAAPTQVCGEFHDQQKLDDALSRLEGSMFQRADLSVRAKDDKDTASYSDQETPVREDDARNLRQLGVGATSAATAMAAAGVVVATGGAALPAVAAAAAAGGATAAAGEAIGQAAAPGGVTEQQHSAEAGGAVLMVHAATPERQAKAEELLNACGAIRVWRTSDAG